MNDKKEQIEQFINSIEQNQTGLKRLEGILQFLDSMGLNTKSLTMEEAIHLMVELKHTVINIMNNKENIASKLMNREEQDINN